MRNVSIFFAIVYLENKKKTIRYLGQQWFAVFICKKFKIIFKGSKKFCLQSFI